MSTRQEQASFEHGNQGKHNSSPVQPQPAASPSTEGAAVLQGTAQLPVLPVKPQAVPQWLSGVGILSCFTAH